MGSLNITSATDSNRSTSTRDRPRPWTKASSRWTPASCVSSSRKSSHSGSWSAAATWSSVS
ncbi:hypothetical protein QEG98_32265 [Myxococcus sp. MxC21-1]|uniref:hypothetical protein n=1 Tax=Myxococcus sp. MxC21-1 TaxID=3041439 RepID=UPI0029317726|nr:hypothetical protein [Myxococcus sp. MxC21-1]WNZ60604.1 hypothetical protein QEG98_32265 [Myxococcus sp. MxC21-1]